MLKVIDLKSLGVMGFSDDGHDKVYYETIEGERKLLFRIYAGSPYIRYPKTAALSDAQVYKIYEWTKDGLITWEDW